MNEITPKEAIEILSHYTDLGYGVVIEGEDTSKIKQALSLARKTLTNGTPYEERPQGDLISREALKEAVKNRFDNSEYFPFHFLALIDNAQPVETFTLEDMQNNYDLGAMHENGKHDRPKGEWIGNAFDEHHCNRCGHPALWEEEPDDYYEVQSRFCPNCGADMRDDKKETAFDDYLKEQLKDPEFRKEWEKLCEEDDNGTDN